jgi:hypothetical protein
MKRDKRPLQFELIPKEGGQARASHFNAPMLHQILELE